MEFIFVILVSLPILLIPNFRRVYFSPRENEAEAQLKGRDNYFDLLKGVAIIAVVVIHITDFFGMYSLNQNLFLSNFINNLARFAIPVFFVCSGVLLNPNFLSRRRIGNFYGRKIVRIFMPYILISVIIALSANLGLGEAIYKISSGTILVPYYFIIVLLQLYILYPLLVRFRKNLWFLYLTFFISLFSYMVPDAWVVGGYPLFLKFLFFFAYGIYKRNDFINYNKQNHKKEIFFWLSVVVLYVLYILFFNEKFYNVRLFYGLAVFNILFYYKDIIMKGRWCNKVLTHFGKISLWIYLLHYLITVSVFLRIDTAMENYCLIFIVVAIISTATSYLVSHAVAYLYGKLYRQ